MSQLIKITTTPIKIAVNVEQGHYEEVERKNDAKREIQRQQRVQALQQQQQAQMAGANQKPVRNVDSYQAQKITAQIPVDLSAIANAMNSRISNASAQLNEISANAPTTSATNMVENYVTTSNVAGYSADTVSDLVWEPTTLNLDLELSFNTDSNYEFIENEGPAYKYVPREISFEVEQYPTVKIEYLGGPQYVPASSDPNYKGDK